jgi:hypothetical protein
MTDTEHEDEFNRIIINTNKRMSKNDFTRFMEDERVTNIVESNKWGTAFLEALQPYMKHLPLVYMYLDAMMEINEDKKNAQINRLNKTNKYLAFFALLSWIVGVVVCFRLFEQSSSSVMLLHLFLIPLALPIVLILIILIPMQDKEFDDNIIKARIVKRVIKLIEYNSVDDATEEQECRTYCHYD